MRRRVRDGYDNRGEIWAGAFARYPQYFELTGALLQLLAVSSVAGLAGLVAFGRPALTSSGRVVAISAAALVLITWTLMVLFWPFGAQGRFLLPAGVTAFAGVVLGTGALLARLRAGPHSFVLGAGAWSVLLLVINVMAMASAAP
jgi:hypothetical protein